jgi:hypothetical protein
MNTEIIKTKDYYAALPCQWLKDHYYSYWMLGLTYRDIESLVHRVCTYPYGSGLISYHKCMRCEVLNL